MPDIDVKLYKDIRVNSQYVVKLTKEHIEEYLQQKNTNLPDDISVGIHHTDGSYTEIDTDNPITVSCASYEQSSTEQDL